MNGLNPPPSHESSENQLLWSSELASWVNFQPLTGQHPQHGHDGQLEQGQLMTPRIPFQPRSIQYTHHDQRWLEEEEVLQRSRDGHDHESQARFEDSETQVGREEAQLFRPFPQTQDYRDEQLDEREELRVWQEMLMQMEEGIEQGGLAQQRDGTIPSLATGFIHQRFQDLQNHQPAYDVHKLNAASSQAHFQQQPDKHGRQLTYQDTQRGDQDRRQNEGQPLQMGSSHVEGHKWKGQPSDDGVMLPQREDDWSHLPSTCDDRSLAWTHLENEGPDFDSLPEQRPYNYTDQQVHRSSWVVDPVPSSPPGVDLDVWQFLPRQATYDHSNQQRQQSMYISQPQQAAYVQQPIWHSTPPDNESWAAAPVSSNPPGMDLDSMTLYQLRLWNNTFDLPTDRNKHDLITQAKTGKPVQVVEKSKRSQKKRNLGGLTAGYAVATPPETGLSAANNCTQAFSVPLAYDPSTEPNMPPVRSSKKRRMHENAPQQPNLRRSKRETAYKGCF